MTTPAIARATTDTPTTPAALHGESGLDAMLVATGLALAATIAALLANWVLTTAHAKIRTGVRVTTLHERVSLWKALSRVPYFSDFDPRPALLTLNTWLLWLGRIAILNFYALTVLGLFPQTRPFNDLLLNSLLHSLANIAEGLLSYFPKLVTIAVTLLVTYHAVRLIRFVFAQMKAHPEDLGFNLPTDLIDAFCKIAIAVAWVFGVMIVAPLLPGLGSQTGQVIGLLVGAMITFGSGSTIGNAVAGLVLAYMRPFETGDRVRIGDFEGDVLERHFTNVRLRTIKNEVVTLTTQAVLTSPITNFSTPLSRERGLILHTRVTIGYNVPRGQVQALMLEAARRTEGVTLDPAPFVLVIELGDFSVSYELNASTFLPHAKVTILSQLQANMLDTFNEAGVEILSPRYQAIRDGNPATVAPAWEAPVEKREPSLIQVVLAQHGDHPHYQHFNAAAHPWEKEEPTA